MRSKDERIEFAAVLHDGKVYTGKRHAAIMQEIWQQFPGTKITQEQQGFVTTSGRFLNRFQSGAVAYMSGQTQVRHQTLLSEYLW